MYNLAHMASLNRTNKLGQIDNLEIMEDQNQFIVDDLIDPEYGQNSFVNFPIKKPIYQANNIAVSEETFYYLSAKYGVDQPIYRVHDSTSFLTDIKDLYNLYNE